MSDSFKDQLLKLGFKRPERQTESPTPKLSEPGVRRPPPPGGKPRAHTDQTGRRESENQKLPHQPQRNKPPRAASAREVDLAKAYALRAQTERSERERAEREAQERARERKDRKTKLAALLDGKALNDGTAEIARHFPHGDKIRRVYVTSEQLTRLNRGELGVVQLQGRYLIVARDVALQAALISADALVLLPDPDAPPEDDIPADLVW